MTNAPVPAPRTFGPGETETGGFLNSQRDGLNFLLNVPAAYLTQSTLQSVPNATWTAVNFDASTFDSYGGHSNSTNNTRYTAQVAGWYMVFGCGSIATNATGQRGTAAAKNGTRIQGAAGFYGAVAGNASVSPSPPTIVFLAAGDYIEIQVYQSSGGALNTAVGVDLDSSVTIVWLHA
jgi:hypothetical protein